MKNQKQLNKIIGFIRNKPALSAGIFIVLVGVFGFWLYQRNTYSKEILKLEILGPEQAELAQEIEYTVKYKNNGNIRLEKAQLVFELPEYSLLGEDEETKKEITLEDIYPGQEQTFAFKARLLGKEGDLKKAQAWLSYQPKNLKARYESTTSLTTQIKSVPLTLEFDLPSKIDSGKEISFNLNYFSNTDYPLTDLGIKIDYPGDFEFLSSRPQTIEQGEFNIGLLNRAEGGRIQITGDLKGEVNEQKQFKAQLGTWQNGEFVVLKESIRAVEIVSTSLYILQQINGDQEYVANAGDTLHYEVFFKNIGNDDFSNLFLVVRLEGDLFDFSTLKATGGDFEMGDNSIVFDWRKVPSLRLLDVGEEGRVEFWIDLKDDWQIAGTGGQNPVLRSKITLSQAQKEFATKVNSKLVVTQNGYYQDEVFGNTGALPPVAGQPTTYTIIWQAKNYYNDVKSAKVKAVLGNNVALTGRIFPDGSRLTFDSNSREVVWEVGDLAAGKGVLDAVPNVAFQVVFTPASYQQGQALNLINDAQVTGDDQFTGRLISAFSPAITTASIQQ